MTVFNVCSAKFTFGDQNEVGTDTKLTCISVSIKWREATLIDDPRAAPYIGYNILVSSDQGQMYTSQKNVTFQVTPDQWQETTLTGLLSRTEYWIKLAVYRIYSDGNVYQSQDMSDVIIITTKNLSEFIIYTCI